MGIQRKYVRAEDRNIVCQHTSAHNKNATFTTFGLHMGGF